MTDASTARAEILARIRSANRRAVASPTAENDWQAIPRDYRQTGTLPPVECVDLFAEQLHDYGAGVYRVQPEQIAATVAEILHRRNAEKMLFSPDIDPAWRGDTDCVWISDHGCSNQDLDGCDGIFTGCTVAIAATGTLCLCHAEAGPSPQGRRAPTLIPDYHLCLVRADQVVETVPQAMRALEPYRTQPITLISGPSATADIEMTRIQGVHGPRTLDVVLAF